MSRRAARFTQAELNRAARVVEISGGKLEIRIDQGVIRIVPIDGARPAPAQEVEPKRRMVF
jgi:hypothetical protein